MICPLASRPLRGAIAWSYDLLSPAEQQLFRRFSVVVDGGSWLAAEQVCSAASPLSTDILEGLLSLVDKSLLRQEEQAEEDEPRFSMLQTLREFGLDVLQGVGETQVTREAHAAYYLEFAEQAEPHLRGAEQARWYTPLEQEHQNLRAALTFLLEYARLTAGTQERQPPAEQALRLCIALAWFWTIRGYVREGLAFLEQALATREEVRASLRAKALNEAADMAFDLDDWEKAERLGSENLPLFRELGDKVGMADSLSMLGTVASARSAYAVARVQVEEAASLYQETGERWKRGRCLTQLARIDTAQGEYDRARILLEESLSLYQALGDKERLAWVLYLLARLLFLSGRDIAAARNLIQQSLALLQEVDAPWYKAYSLVLLGQITHQQGEQARAREMFEQSVDLFKEVGDREGRADALLGLSRVELRQGDLLTAQARYQESLVLMHEIDYKEGIALGLEGLAAVAARQGEPQRAARLWGAAEALRERIGAPIPPIERADYEQAVEGARSQLGEQAFAAVWAEGRAIPLEQVIDDALKLRDEEGKQ